MSKTLLLTVFSVLIVMLLSCGNPTTTENDPDSVIDADGNVYTTVKIGNQLWTVENLRTTKYNDGSAVPHITDNAAWEDLNTPGYCYYNNTTNADSIKKFGALYNWFAIDTKKLAPKGWHVPTDAEWTILEKYLVLNGYNWDGTTDTSALNKIGKSLAAKTDWITSTNVVAIGNDLSTNNSSGFSALPGGSRYLLGDFYDRGGSGNWWSATEYAASRAYYRHLYYGNDYLFRYYYSKEYGLSVRLVKD